MNTPVVQPTAASVPLVAQRQLPSGEKIPKIVEIPQLQFLDKFVDVQLCCDDKCL